MKLVEEIKEALELKIRTSPSDDNEYFEAVFQSKDVDTLSALLRKNIGEPLKLPGKGAKVPGYINRLVKNIGTIRREQSFYLKRDENGEYVYVMLWPWQSDPSKITLKIGKGNFSSL